MSVIADDYAGPDDFSLRAARRPVVETVRAV
jgi:hypothetical protein